MAFPSGYALNDAANRGINLVQGISAKSASDATNKALEANKAKVAAARMIVTKGGVAFPISRNVVFAIVLISVILVASTAAVTYAVLSAQGKIGSSGRIIAIGVKVTAVGSNQDLTNIDWGDLTAGATATRQISVINNGTSSNNTLDVSWRLGPIDCTTIPHHNMELRFRHRTSTRRFADCHYHYQC